MSVHHCPTLHYLLIVIPSISNQTHLSISTMLSVTVVCITVFFVSMKCFFCTITAVFHDLVKLEANQNDSFNCFTWNQPIVWLCLEEVRYCSDLWSPWFTVRYRNTVACDDEDYDGSETQRKCLYRSLYSDYSWIASPDWITYGAGWGCQHTSFCAVSHVSGSHECLSSLRRSACSLSKVQDPGWGRGWSEDRWLSPPGGTGSSADVGRKGTPWLSPQVKFLLAHQSPGEDSSCCARLGKNNGSHDALERLKNMQLRRIHSSKLNEQKKLSKLPILQQNKYQTLQACKFETYWIWRWDEHSSSWIPSCLRPDRCTFLRRPRSRDGSQTYWDTCRQIRSRSRWTSGWWRAAYWSLSCYWTWT